MNNNKTQFLGTKKAISKWLDKYGVSNYTINDDLSVDVNGDVIISYQNLKVIPVKFGNVIGDFRCSYNELTNLAGSPDIVSGDFYCNHNKLISLLGSPKTVGRNFDCEDNQLINLAGVPEMIDGYFSCNSNQLTNVFNFPKAIRRGIYCCDNPLSSLLGFIDCNFTGIFYFSIDKSNFKPKELIQVLKTYYESYDSVKGCYKVHSEEFNDKIRPELQKIILQQKLVNSKLKNKIKPSFL